MAKLIGIKNGKLYQEGGYISREYNWYSWNRREEKNGPSLPAELEELCLLLNKETLLDERGERIRFITESYGDSEQLTIFSADGEGWDFIWRGTKEKGDQWSSPKEILERVLSYNARYCPMECFKAVARLLGTESRQRTLKFDDGSTFDKVEVCIDGEWI